MDNLLATYNGNEDEDEDNASNNNATTNTTQNNVEIIANPPVQPLTTTAATATTTTVDAVTSPIHIDTVAPTATTSTTSATPDTETGTKDDPIASEDLSDVEATNKDSPNFSKIISSSGEEELDADEEERPVKKQKKISALAPKPGEEDQSVEETPPPQKPSKKSASNSKKKKSKGNSVWTKPTSRKGKKRTKSTTNTTAPAEDSVLITPIQRYPDRNDDTPDSKICLSKVYKAEKVELSEDRLSAGSCKGYRMVRATRGVMEGAWYFEIKVVSLGETGHTRLGWSTEKGDLQAPVGYDGNSYGFRDIDGSKVHKALREKYGEEGYVEGDVIGFYISLPEGSLYAPKPPQLVLYKGQRYAYASDAKEDPPKTVPGSEISFFRNGKCQGVAFTDLPGGRYFPAASMYTLPGQNNCVVRFNFGPDFEAFPEDFGGRPVPRPMIEVPYHGFEGRVQNGLSNEKQP